MRRIRRLLIALIALTPILAAVPAHAASSTVVVLPGDMATNAGDVLAKPTSWFFYNDETDGIDNSLGSFVSGPSSPPAGTGSVQISVSGTQRRNLATYQFSGKKLADITVLKFSTYNPSAGNGGSVNRSGYLNFNVDFNGTDTWQNRLVYVPTSNGTVHQNQWDEWDAINGGNAMWVYSGATWPVTGQPGTTAKTWSQIKTDYPTASTRTTDSWLGLRVGEPYADGYTENLDKFVFGTASGTTTYDFEPTVGPPTSKNDCKNNGWKKYNSPSFKNQGKCIDYVEKHSPADEVQGTLKMSGPSQKIKFNINDNDRDHDDNHHGWGWWHRSNKDTIEYWNYDYPGVLHYKADVACVGGDKSLNEARVMFQIPAGHPGLSGLYIVAYTKEVKHGTDLYGHAATGDLATATAWCETGAGFAPAMYPVTQGKVEIN